jgi:hypothetical protein
MRIRPKQLARISINTGGHSLFWQAFSELQSSLVHTAVSLFVCKFGGEFVVGFVAANRLCFGLDYLLVMVWTILSTLVWCVILGER